MSANTQPQANTPTRAFAVPVAAVEWACHAATTIKDAKGVVLAECSGHGRDSGEDVAIAAQIVQRVNAQDDLLRVLGDAEGFILGFEDDSTQVGVPQLLADIRATIAKATRGAR